MRSNRCEVLANELDEGGRGVGVADGRRIHVADLLPGERAEVAIDHHSPHKPEAWGHIVRRTGPSSPDRRRPACPAFGRCGGCTWQHLAYPAQLTAKHRRVELALTEARAGAARDVAIAPVRPSPAELGYRNKGKYVAAAGRGVGGSLVLGAYAPRSHTVIDTTGCAVVTPVIDEVATWVRGAAEQARLTTYDERTRTGELRYVIVREVRGEVLVALVVATTADADKLARVAAVLATHPAVRGVVALDNDRRDGAIVPTGAATRVLHGEGHLVEQLAGVDLEVGAGEFLQVNRVQAQAMYARIAELALEAPPSGPAGSTHEARTIGAVDLYAGLGGIGLHLARAGAQVVAIEIDRDAVSRLQRAADRGALPVTAIEADADDLSAAVRARLGTPAVVVINPPRKGLTAGALQLLVDLGAPTIVYVSCGPDALGRDLLALAAHGWVADVIEPFDLMPGTAQVETVVRLRR